MASDPPFGFAQLAEFFEPDGALRDIVALDTTADSWRQMMRWIVNTNWEVEFRHQSEATADPEVVLRAFEPPYSGSVVRCYAGPMQLVASPLWTDEIEFTLDPSEVNAQSFAVLCDFIAQLAQAVDRVVAVTADNCREFGNFACTAQGEFCLIDRPALSTALSASVAERLSPMLALLDEPDGLTIASIHAVRNSWPSTMPSPGELPWHTELTTRQAAALDRLNHQLYVASLAEQSLQEVLLLAIERARQAFGLDSSQG